MSIYKRETIAYIRRMALKQVKGATSVSHIFPRAYCVAKTALQCAVFAYPRDDAEPQVKFQEPFTIISNDSVAGVHSGDWCAIAYVAKPQREDNYVIFLE